MATQVLPIGFDVAPTLPGGTPLPGGASWDKARYRLDNRRVDLDKAAAGITFTQDGDDILITVEAGTAVHANPSAGAYLVWDPRDAINGNTFDFNTNPGFQGVAAAHLAFFSGLGSGQGVEVCVGRIDDTAVSQQGLYAGVFDGPAPHRVVANRMLSSALSRVLDASASGNVVAVLQDVPKNIGTSTIITNRNYAMGLINTDPRAADPGVSPWDRAEGAGGLAYRELLCLNVRNASAGVTTVTANYRVRVRTFIIPWGA